MDTLVRGFLNLRVAFARGLGVAALSGYALGLGTLGLKPGVLGFGGCCVVLVGARLWLPRFRALALRELEAGQALMLVVYTLLLRFDGGPSGVFSSLLYVVMAWTAALCKRGTAFATLVFTLGLDALVRHRLGLSLRGPLYLERTFLLTSLALLGTLFLAVQATRIRMGARAQIAGEIDKLKDEARSFRLLGTGGDKVRAGEDRLERSSVEEIHQSVHYALDLLRRTLHLHTAVLLWKNDAGTHYRISELSTDSDDISDAPIAVGDGVLAACEVRREIVSASHLRSTHHVPYYAAACPVSCLSAIPIVEDSGIVRGVLAIDRTRGPSFTKEEEDLASQAARYCLRAIQNERVFLQLERAKVEQGKLYRAAQSLGAAITEHEVLEAGVRAAREIASFDLAAVTIFDEDARRHEVVAALGSDPKFRELVGASFRHNTGLVSMVVQNRFALPYRGDFDAEHQVVLSKRYPWPALPSLLVLPLVLRGNPLGTLILGSRRRHAFGESVRATLEVLASHLAVSLSNARMVHKLEMLATTDGLTGLLNKRAMLDAATQKIEAANRFKRRLSVLIVDIDHFKKVNDTYGHDVGDVVIKGLGAILARHKRGTDVVARFGGEEFVVLCEQTDEAGALLLAERIREELSAKVFAAPQASFGVTCSLGIATLPNAGTTWEGLFKAADDALYVSKRSGRNRASVAPERRATPVPSAVVPASRSKSKGEKRAG
jgi:two-component system, cell cycle response regulator